MEQSGNLIDDGLVPEDKDLSVFDPHVLPKESVFAEITASHTAQEDTVNAIGDGEVDGGRVVTRFLVGRVVESLAKNNGSSANSIGYAHYVVLESFGWIAGRGMSVSLKNGIWKSKKNGQWEPFELYTTDRYDTRANQFNVVHPAAPTQCDAIRINVHPRDGTAVGIIEVQVTFEEKIELTDS